MFILESYSFGDYFEKANSVVKIAIFLIIWAFVWFPIPLLLAKLMKWQTFAPTSDVQKLTLIFSLYLFAPFWTWVVLKLGDTSLEQIGISFQVSFFQSILFGYGISILTFVAIYVFEWGIGWLNFSPQGILKPSIALDLMILVIISIFISSIEELVFRGVFVNFLRCDYSLWVSGIISSVIFALLHLVWEQKNTVYQLPGLFFLGLVLFYGVVVRGNSLDWAIGLHGGWVLALACVDSFNLVSYQDNLPSWVIGSREKPLGSVAGILVLLFGALILHFLDI